MSAFPEMALAPERKPPRNWRPFIVLVGLISIPLILIDQLSKLYVSTHLTLYDSIPVVTNWFDITYTQNPGAAFSMFATLPPILRTGFLFVLASAAIIVLLVLLAESEKITLRSVSFALILAGASGNLIDRALRGGRVIDFLRVHYYGLNYPIFNVADSAISIGVALIVLSTFFARHESS